MKKFTTILLLCVIHVSVSAEKISHSNRALFSSSESLAFEMGRTFQLAKNCGQDMPNISAIQAAHLFENYFERREVNIIMKHYEHSVAQEKEKSCNREKVNFHKLMNKMSVYIRAVNK